MLICLDVDYRGNEAVVGSVLFQKWQDAEPFREQVERLSEIAPYEPGQFYKREMPCLLKALDRVEEPLEAIVIDGYVWLNEHQSPGLGGHLYQALQGAIPVIGIAKTSFAPARAVAEEVCRGESRKPLFVTAVGIDPKTAAIRAREMHGEHRIPTLLKRVDQLCRNG